MAASHVSVVFRTASETSQVASDREAAAAKDREVADVKGLLEAEAAPRAACAD